MSKVVLTAKRKRKFKIDKDLLQFFPKPSRMGVPVPSRWEKPSLSRANSKEKQAIRNSYSY